MVNDGMVHDQFTHIMVNTKDICDYNFYEHW